MEGPVGTGRNIVPNVTAVKLGGHFPGSLVLHWEQKLFVADTLLIVPVSGTVLDLSSNLKNLDLFLPYLNFLSRFYLDPFRSVAPSC